MSILLEGLLDAFLAWLLGRDDVTTGWQRAERIALAIGVLALVAATVIVIARIFG